MDVVHDISDWVVVMGEGRIIAEGTPDQISANHAVIDAYLGAHHDAPLTAAEEQAPARRGRGGHRGGAGGTTMADDARCRRSRSTSSPSPRTTGSARCSTADDVVAGYVPGVDILNGCDARALRRASWSASSAPTAPASPRCSRPCSGSCRCAPGTVTLRGDDITDAKAHRLVALGVGYVPQNNNVFPSLTVRGEPRDGRSTSAARSSTQRFEEVCDALPAARRAGASSGPARSPAASARWWPWAGR